MVAAFDSTPPSGIRVTDTHAIQTVLFYPRLLHDSIAGYSGSSMPRSVYQVVAVKDVRYWERRELDDGKTLQFAILTGLFVGLIAALKTLANCCQ